MAKELPYFKFEPGEYESGNISICSLAAQGVWNRVCNIYWLRLGDVTLKHLQRKLGYEDLIQELIDEGCIKINGDHVVINFLDLQMAEFQDKSKKGSNAAKVRWAKERKRAAMVNEDDSNADAMQTHSERNANRVEYSRIEENRVEDTPPISPKGELDVYEILTGEFEAFFKINPIPHSRGKAERKFIELTRNLVSSGKFKNKKDSAKYLISQYAQYKTYCMAIGQTKYTYPDKFLSTPDNYDADYSKPPPKQIRKDGKVTGNDMAREVSHLKYKPKLY